MITFQEAREIAETAINRQQSLLDDILIIIDEQIVENDHVWIFPYASKKFLETNDINHIIGGNGPFFVSKLDGKISNYRTGLSIEGMIDQYEEDNKIWNLALTDDIFIDTNKTRAFRQTLGLAIPEIVDFKKNTRTPFESGAKRRLVGIQNQLSLKGIPTSLTQRVVKDKTKP